MTEEKGQIKNKWCYFIKNIGFILFFIGVITLFFDTYEGGFIIAISSIMIISNYKEPWFFEKEGEEYEAF